MIDRAPSRNITIWVGTEHTRFILISAFPCNQGLATSDSIADTFVCVVLRLLGLRLTVLVLFFSIVSLLLFA